MGWAHTPPHGLQPGDTSQGSCPHTHRVAGRVALIWEGRGQSVLVVILCLLGSTASARGKHPEPTLECTPAPTVGPAAPWGLAAGAEGLACDEPPAGEAKPLQIVVTAALQESPAPLGALEEEQAPPPALEVVDVPQPPPNSMEQLASGMEQPVEPPEEPAPAPTVEPGEGSGSEGIVAAGDEDLVKAEMLAPEVKVVHVLVEPMVPCPDEEEPPAPMATPEE